MCRPRNQFQLEIISRMSALGQKQTSAYVPGTSALPHIAPLYFPQGAYGTQQYEIRADWDKRGNISQVSDLNFGDYVRLVEEPERWQQLNIEIDRATFCKELDLVRRIRNDIMHFDPDPLPPEDLTRLRKFAQFLKTLNFIGVPS